MDADRIRSEESPAILSRTGVFSSSLFESNLQEVNTNQGGDYVHRARSCSEWFIPAIAMSVNFDFLLGDCWDLFIGMFLSRPFPASPGPFRYDGVWSLVSE